MSNDSANSEIRQRLNKVFCDVFDDEEIVVFDEMSSKDIDDWDSLMHITLVVAIEKEFSIRLDAAEVGKLENVGAMIQLIDERLHGRNV